MSIEWIVWFSCAEGISGKILFLVKFHYVQNRDGIINFLKHEKQVDSITVCYLLTALDILKFIPDPDH
jgi:hypothetical protein